jgi:hypothetical protein
MDTALERAVSGALISLAFAAPFLWGFFQL